MRDPDLAPAGSPTVGHPEGDRLGGPSPVLRPLGPPSPVVVGWGRWVLGGMVFASGAGALILQVTWERMIALHNGVDLASATTVVAAFLAGLGVGSLVGGRLADRRGPVAALRVLVVAEAGIAGCALLSPRVLDEGYRALAPHLGGAVSTFTFHALVLLVPTTLMGTSLPLVARAVTGDPGRAGTMIGRYNATNTLGAACGAAVGGWYLLGTLGLAGTTRFVVGLEVAVVAALVALIRSMTSPHPRARQAGLARGLAGLVLIVVSSAWYQAARSGSRVAWNPILAGGLAATGLVLVVRAVVVGRRTDDDLAPTPGPLSIEEGLTPSPDVATIGRESAARPDPGGPTRWPWMVAYAGTGAVALGFEQVFFRLIDGVMRSNTYTFGHVLALYLALLAAGAAGGSALVRRAQDPRQWFLWMQAGVGVTAVATLIAFLDVLPAAGLGPRMDIWFASDGFAAGLEAVGPGDRLVFGLVVPLVLMAPPVVLMGASFPFVAQIVTRDLARVGRGTGAVVCVNLAGNVAGALITGFVLIDRLGVAGTYVALALPLMAAGVVAAVRGRRSPTVGLQLGVAIAVLVTAVAVLPSNVELWAVLNDSRPEDLILAEDRSCASALKQFGSGGSQLTLNGTSQNGHPFDDFHVLIGLLPALAQDDPDRALAVGFGVGSTSFGMLASERPRTVTSIELCGGNYAIAQELADRGEPDFVRLTTDARHETLVGDGRRHLLVDDERYDVIVPDHSRPTSAGAGNLFSREFFDLMSSRLTDDGVAAGWIPTYRVENAVTTTFPYSAAVTVESYNGSRLFLASRSPLTLDPDVLVARFDRIPDGTFAPQQRRDLRRFLAGLAPECLTDGRRATGAAPSAENRDLFPRDEYSLANGGAAEDQVVRTCGP